MEHEQTNQVIDTMNVLERARALRDAHQAMLLASLFDAIASRVRGALTAAGHAMTLVYGKSVR
jgi:hypothetical protein